VLIFLAFLTFYNDLKIKVPSQIVIGSLI